MAAVDRASALDWRAEASIGVFILYIKKKSWGFLFLGHCTNGVERGICLIASTLWFVKKNNNLRLFSQRTLKNNPNRSLSY